MYYRIGLDLGIASVGAAVISTDSEGNPKKIEGLYSRVFDACEVANTGESLAKSRRENRGVRRRLRRRGLRLVELRQLFSEKGVEYTPNVGVLALRYEALSRAISEEEFAAVIYTIVKHRGFKSSKKNPESTSDKDEGKLLASASKIKADLEAGGYATVGEMLYKRSLETCGAIRNKGGEYTIIVLRALLEDELKVLFERQRAFGNRLATPDVEARVLDIFTRQRTFDDGPGLDEHGVQRYSASFKIGKCEHERQEDRAPKCSYSATMFELYQRINNTIIKNDREDRLLTDEEREKIVAKFHSSTTKELTYTQVRKLLKLSDDERFNHLSYNVKEKDGTSLTKAEVNANVEKAKFISAKGYGDIVKALDAEHVADHALINEVARILIENKSVKKRTQELASNESTRDKLSAAEIDNLVDISVSKVGHVSILAIDKMLPYLEQGKKYSEAVEMAGYKFSKAQDTIKTKYLRLRDNDNLIGDIVDEITSPVVKRTVTQTIKVLNAIIRQYGSPLAINIELAREMSKSKKERDNLKKDNDERYLNNLKSREAFEDKFPGIVANRDDMLRWRLYEEQGGKCPYSGKTIDVRALFNDDMYEIDHIMPYSRCFNDSYNNKVLVLTDENRHKGNRLPYEYMSETQFCEFTDRVVAMYSTRNSAKMRNLLRDSMDESEMKDRALNDTRYISRFMLNLIEDHLEFAEGDLAGKRRVRAVAGGMTAKLRYLWGIKKVRADGARHHAVDAAVIACATDSAMNNISRYYKSKENMDAYVNYGAVSNDIVRKAPEPYEGFSDELNARCLSDEDSMADSLRAVGYSEDEVAEARPIFVSHMPNHKGKGAIHEETIYKMIDVDNVDKKGNVTKEHYQVKKVALDKLSFKNDKKGEYYHNGYYIDKFYRPNENMRLYNALIDRYIECGCDTKKAFTEPFYKPSDSSNGPIVRTVRTVEKNNSAVEVGSGSNRRGYADNGSMIRLDIFTRVKTNSKGVVQLDKETHKPVLEYYGVPVYTNDLYSGKLPMKAVVAAKPIEEWPIMDEAQGYEFAFSVYPHDLIYIEKKDGLALTKVRDDENSRLPDTKYANYVYYRAFSRSTGAMTIEDDTKAYEGGSVGIKTLKCLKKCTVDVLGNKDIVDKREHRQPLSLKR